MSIELSNEPEKIVRMGLAEHFELKDNYAELPVPWAFNRIEGIIPYLLAQEVDVERINGTAFYSRRQDLNSEERMMLYRLDQKARVAAVGQLAYLGGPIIEKSVDKGEGPYGMPFTADCMSTCLLLSDEDTEATMSTPAHKEAVKHAPDAFGKNIAIVKYRISIEELSWVPEDDVRRRTGRLAFHILEQPDTPENRFYYPKIRAA